MLEHPKLGELTIKPGEAMTAWNVKNFLSAKAIYDLQTMVDKALKGDEAILAELEALLPAVEDLIRDSIAKDPGAKGAPALRTLLSLFDE